jgi:hypothetical protein
MLYFFWCDYFAELCFFAALSLVRVWQIQLTQNRTDTSKNSNFREIRHLPVVLGCINVYMRGNREQAN